MQPLSGIILTTDPLRTNLLQQVLIVLEQKVLKISGTGTQVSGFVTWLYHNRCNENQKKQEIILLLLLVPSLILIFFYWGPFNFGQPLKQLYTIIPLTLANWSNQQCPFLPILLCLLSPNLVSGILIMYIERDSILFQTQLLLI